MFAPPPAALRVALWCFAAVNVIAGIPLLLRIDDVGMAGADPSHLTRDGALAVVLGVVAGVVAHQPRRARALSLVVLSIIALNVLGGSADVARGVVDGRIRVDPRGERDHRGARPGLRMGHQPVGAARDEGRRRSDAAGARDRRRSRVALFGGVRGRARHAC